MKKPIGIFVVATISMAVLLTIASLSFGKSMDSHMQGDIEYRLRENIDQNIVSFQMQVSEQIQKVNTFAQVLGKNWDLGKNVHVNLLQAVAENNGLFRCAIAYPDGSFVANDGMNEGTASQDAFFAATMRGESFITDPRPSLADKSKRVLLFAAPIYNENKEILGSIVYSYLCDDMDKIFNLHSMGGEMNLVVTKQSGELLIGQTPFAQSQENIVEYLRNQCTHERHPALPCLLMTEEKAQYIVTFADDRDAIYVSYDRLPFNDWYMLATIPATAAAESMSFVARIQQYFSIAIAIIIGGYILVLLWLWWRQGRAVDAGTGALTRSAFKRRAKRIFKMRKDEQYVVVKLDVKGFKLINRIYSFAIGDQLLRNISQALQTVLASEKCSFARIGVDAFALLLPYEGPAALDSKRQEFISQFRLLMGEGFGTKIIFPTGQYVLHPSDYPKPDMDNILEKVNFAHQAAKGNADVIIDYEEDIESAALLEKNIEDRMEDAIRDGEFALYLQPKIRLEDESLCGAEALVRWKIGEKQYMYPTDFVPILEKNGFILQVDMYMFTCAAAYIQSCIKAGIKPIPISVNFSRHHLNNETLVEELCSIADAHGVARKYLEIEITESAFLGNINSIVRLIQRLHEEGFMISMDDFGNGYSCFAQLKDLKIDTLKIDRGFFTESADEKRAEIVIAGIVKIAQKLQITTVAEGIERKEQVEMLKLLGCDIVQGYYYARPRPAAELDIENFTIPAGEEDDTGL